MELKREDIKLGYACNNNCLFCILGDKKESFSFRPIKEIKNDMVKSYSEGVRKILLTGGEPTLRKDIVDIVSFAKKTGFEIIHIETNGRMLAYKDLADQLMNAGANAFSISFHSPNAKIFALQSRTSEKAFEEVLSGLKNLSDLGQKIRINCTITKMNYSYLEEIVQLLSKFNVEGINFPFVNPSGSAWSNKEEILVKFSEVKSKLKNAIALAKSNGWDVTTEMIPFCFVEGNEECVMEQYKKNMRVNAPDYFDKDFDKTRLSSRVKGKQCKECIYDDKCEGVTKNYAFLYGLDELEAKK